MITKNLLTAMGAVALCLFVSKAVAADAFNPDSEGYIRHWVMLAPIVLPEGETCAEALLKDQIKNEAALRPKAGDKAAVGGKELSWRDITAETNYFEQLPPIWDQYWGYLVEKDIAPVWIAEFGTADELPWLGAIVDYAKSRGIHFAYRALNPNTDTRIGGILQGDYVTVNQDKQSRLAPALAPLIP